MKPEEIHRLAEFETFYWWFRARRELVEHWLRWFVPDRSGPLLDAGCGAGELLAQLTREGAPVFGIDRSALAVEYSARRLPGRVAAGDAQQLGFGAATMAGVVCLDLLEHLPDDAAALRECFRVLRPGGWLLLTVPAYPFLWSEHDEALDHRRRYMMHGLRRLVTGAGFRLEKYTYQITLLLPVVIGYRFLRSLRPRAGGKRTDLVVLPRPLNGLLLLLCRLEIALGRWLNYPAGVSLAVLARKPPAGP